MTRMIILSTFFFFPAVIRLHHGLLIKVDHRVARSTAKEDVVRHAGVLAGCFVAIAAFALPATAAAQLVIGPGPGTNPAVRVFDATGDHMLQTYDPAFAGGVRVAMGDIDGDGTADIITGAGPGGGPHVLVFSGVDRHVLASFYAYDPRFTGGVSVAAGDIDGDGRTDIITGAGPGGGLHVTVFSGADLHVLANLYAPSDPGFPGGVSVAAGDVNGDGRVDIVTGAGPGGGPHVLVFSGANLSLLASFDAYNPGFLGGVSVAAGDLNGDGRSDVITGPGRVAARTS